MVQDRLIMVTAIANSSAGGACVFMPTPFSMLCLLWPFTPGVYDASGYPADTGGLINCGVTS